MIYGLEVCGPRRPWGPVKIDDEEFIYDFVRRIRADGYIQQFLKAGNVFRFQKWPEVHFSWEPEFVDPNGLVVEIWEFRIAAVP